MKFKLNKTTIGDNSPSYIIAELSCNHNQDISTAIKTIREIKKSGANAVKIQTYTPDTITIDCNNKYFKIKHGTLWDGTTLHDLYKKAYTPWEWQPKLQKVALDLGLDFFSSPFDSTAVDFLRKLHVPAYKVASFEIKDIPLIRKMAKQKKPMIISTGIAELEDIKLAIKTCHEAGNKKIILLKCTSSYPTPLDEVNLLTMVDMQKKFNTIVGVSDHTMGSLVPIAATSLGGKVIEKHFILDRKMGGPDSEFSMEPHEFKEMVDSIRNIEQILGKPSYDLGKKAKKAREFGRSLFIVADVKVNDTISERNVRSIRPGYGLHPKYLEKVIGKKFIINAKKGTPLTLDHIK